MDELVKCFLRVVVSLILIFLVNSVHVQFTDLVFRLSIFLLISHNKCLDLNEKFYVIVLSIPSQCSIPKIK